MSNISGDATIDVEAADVLRLIQAHLTEAGLHESCRVIREESGVAAAGVCHSNLKSYATNGNWGLVLDSLSTLDPQRSHIPRGIISDCHEMAILELADNGEVELAYAALRFSADELDAVGWSESETPVAAVDAAIPRSRLIEQRLAALTALRASSKKRMDVPADFYGTLSKEERRKRIGARLAETVPVVPSSRLSALLQQGVKWQAHTGELPMVRNHWEQEEDSDSNKKKSKRRRKVFDIVLGEVDAPIAVVGESTRPVDAVYENIPSRVYSTIKFGKKATAECAVFLPDGSGLITGSSDGLLEIRDSKQKFSELRMDLPYQTDEDVLWHSTAIMSVAVSNDGTLLASGGTDGTVKVWRIDTGKCLREIVAHDGAVVSCLTFSNDGTHVLSGSHDTTCREFGLRTSRMLKEFRGHASYVNSCYYSLVDGGNALRVLTGSADGTVRVWDKSSELLHVLRPVSLGRDMTTAGTSILMDHQTDSSSDGGSPNVHSVLLLHTPRQCMIIVPRGSRAFLSDYSGRVVRIFDVDSSEQVFVAATVSPSSNRWLYAATDAGGCCVFDIQTGALEKTIRDFALQCTSSSSDKSLVELSGLLHHPQKPILAAFSNNKSQKRGLITLWK